LLGINDFKPQPRQLFALIPLLLLLLTLYRINNIPPIIYDSIKNENTYETPIQTEEIKVEASKPVIISKPIEIAERQMQDLLAEDQKVVAKIPVAQNEIKSHENLSIQTLKPIHFMMAAGIILLRLNPRTILQ